MSDFTPADLPRVSERIPYLYLEQCVIKRANNALVAADENGETALPIATIAVLMLGPPAQPSHMMPSSWQATPARSSYGPESRESATIAAVPHSPAPPDCWNSRPDSYPTRGHVSWSPDECTRCDSPAKICPIRRCANCSAWKAPESQPCTRLRRSATTYNGTAGNGMTVAERSTSHYPRPTAACMV